MKAWLFGFFLFLTFALMAQSTSNPWADFTYTQGFFGPNALPLPEISDARVASCHSFELSGDCFWGDGDKTQNMAFHAEYVIPERISIAAWGTLAERAQVGEALRDKRCSLAKDGRSFEAVGSIYLTTRIAIWQEVGYIPDIVANITLKTASEASNRYARYFDTPGYYFLMETGKNLWQSTSAKMKSLRLVGNLGFLCYQMNNKYQNDAPIYALKLKADFARYSLETLYGGYDGWIDKGDHHHVARVKLNYHLTKMDCSLQYQYGIKDAAPHRLQLATRYYFGK